VRGKARAGLGSQFENLFGLKEAVDEVMARPPMQQLVPAGERLQAANHARALPCY
jgi:hypothetical protein